MRDGHEAFTALDAGAQALKIFPSSAFGPDYIKALKAVLPPECRSLPWAA
jgi:2-dehydro-3-deoxyphosphogalactonate aldolase